MAWLPAAPKTVAATFTVLEGAGAGKPLKVQFNPASLEYSISTEFDDRNGNNGARQFVKKSTAKLTMTLFYDTTDTGASVRSKTEEIAKLLQPAEDGSKKSVPKLEFGWGAYAFQGVIEQYKETIDFFSAEGVPLRASINLTLSSQEVEFLSNRNPQPAVDRTPRADPVSLPPGAAPSDAAGRAGDPRAARGIAQASGAASLRFGGSASLSVGGSVSLAAAANFSVGGGAGLGVGGGAGLGIGGGASAGAGFGVSGGIGGGASFGTSGGASFGAAGFSAGSSGITATAGAAFAGLRASPALATISVGDARAALLPAPQITGSASFGPGGRARIEGGGSLSADVGAASLSGRIGFGD